MTPSAFEPVPTLGDLAVSGESDPAAGQDGGQKPIPSLSQGQSFVVCSDPWWRDRRSWRRLAATPSSASTPSMSVGFPAPLAGNVFKVLVKAGEPVAAGQVVIILEAMKMETEVRATSAGVVSECPGARGRCSSRSANLY